MNSKLKKKISDVCEVMIASIVGLVVATYLVDIGLGIICALFNASIFTIIKIT